MARVFSPRATATLSVPAPDSGRVATRVASSRLVGWVLCGGTREGSADAAWTRTRSGGGEAIGVGREEDVMRRREGPSDRCKVGLEWSLVMFRCRRCGI
jgi:hypothetical protein